MIFGIGSDIANMNRIEALMQVHPKRFCERVLTPAERARLENVAPPLQAAWVAKRYAGKEAVVKALGTGFEAGVYFKDIEIGRDKMGKPHVILSGGAKNYLEKHAPNDMVPKIDISLSDDTPMALAFVVISFIQKQIT